MTTVAIVGAGYTAREHARAFVDVEGVRLAGIFSRTKARAERLAQETGIDQVCESIDELYERTQADLVVVAVPELELNRVARSVFRFSWAVLVEKPPGYDVGDAQDIERAASQAGRKVFVALNRRFLSSTQQVLDRIAATDGPRVVVVQDQQNLEEARRSGKPETVVRNYMFANSIHTIDYIRMLCRGEIEAVRQLVPWRPERPGFVLADVTFSSGDRAVYQAMWDAPGPWAVTASVPGVRWEMRPLEVVSEQYLGEQPHDLPVHPWDSAFKPGFRAQAEAVTRAITSSGAEAVTLSEALATMRLIARIYGMPDGESTTGVAL